MSKPIMRILFFMTFSLLHVLADAQHCTEIKHQANLLVAKKPNLSQIKHVRLTNDGLVAHKGFKFVQLRNSHTFVCLPDDFKSAVVDFKYLQKPNRHTKMILDASVPLVQLRCSSEKEDCQHHRCGKACLSCGGECAGVSWVSTSLPGPRLVIIPTFKSRT